MRLSLGCSSLTSPMRSKSIHQEGGFIQFCTASNKLCFSRADDGRRKYILCPSLFSASAGADTLRHLMRKGLDLAGECSEDCAITEILVTKTSRKVAMSPGPGARLRADVDSERVLISRSRRQWSPEPLARPHPGGREAGSSACCDISVPTARVCEILDWRTREKEGVARVVS